MSDITVASSTTLTSRHGPTDEHKFEPRREGQKSKRCGKEHDTYPGEVKILDARQESESADQCGVEERKDGAICQHLSKRLEGEQVAGLDIDRSLSKHRDRNKLGSSMHTE